MHTKEEIFYINHELTLEDVLAIANEVEEFDDSDSDENFGKDVNDDKIEIELLDETLDLKEIFDLNHEIFRENDQNNNIRSVSEHIAKEDPNYNYVVNNL
ncbi:17104_t:CDS:1, partial [Gigaspora margarita]